MGSEVFPFKAKEHDRGLEAEGFSAEGVKQDVQIGQSSG